MILQYVYCGEYVTTQWRRSKRWSSVSNLDLMSEFNPHKDASTPIRTDRVSHAHFKLCQVKSWGSCSKWADGKEVVSERAILQKGRMLAKRVRPVFTSKVTTVTENKVTPIPCRCRVSLLCSALPCGSSLFSHLLLALAVTVQKVPNLSRVSIRDSEIIVQDNWIYTNIVLVW